VELQAHHRSIWLIVSDRAGKAFHPTSTFKYAQQLQKRRRLPPHVVLPGCVSDEGAVERCVSAIVQWSRVARSKAARQAARGSDVVASRRWDLLRAALRRKHPPATKSASVGTGAGVGAGAGAHTTATDAASSSDASSVSVRRHSTFNLLVKHDLPPSTCGAAVFISSDRLQDSVSWHEHAQRCLREALCPLREAESKYVHLTVVFHGANDTTHVGSAEGAAREPTSATSPRSTASCDKKGKTAVWGREVKLHARALEVATCVHELGFSAVPTHCTPNRVQLWVDTKPSEEPSVGHCKSIVERYSVPVSPAAPACNVLVTRRRPDAISLEDLASHHSSDGVDNTGNVCVWPAEEVLAHLCVQIAHVLANRAVVELGAGMTGLAGLVAAASTRARRVTITDGNKAAAQNVAQCVALNAFNAGASASQLRVDTQQLVWSSAHADEAKARVGAADVVMAADCLFFKDFHVDLVDTLAALVNASPRKDGDDASSPAGSQTVLEVDGRLDERIQDLGFPQVWLVAPRRGATMDLFISHALRRFNVAVAREYDAAVSHAHERCMTELAASGQYDPDIHYPLLLVLTPLRDGGADNATEA